MILAFFLIENRKTAFRSRKAGKTKNALADKILDLLGDGWGIDPNQLYVNRGASIYNDWCSWHGCVYSPDGTKYDICSWVSMGKLVKQDKIGFVGELKLLGVNEIS